RSAHSGVILRQAQNSEMALCLSRLLTKNIGTKADSERLRYLAPNINQAERFFSRKAVQNAAFAFRQIRELKNHSFGESKAALLCRKHYLQRSLRNVQPVRRHSHRRPPMIAAHHEPRAPQFNRVNITVTRRPVHGNLDVNANWQRFAATK